MKKKKNKIKIKIKKGELIFVLVVVLVVLILVIVLVLVLVVVVVVASCFWWAAIYFFLLLFSALWRRANSAQAPAKKRMKPSKFLTAISPVFESCMSVYVEAQDKVSKQEI